MAFANSAEVLTPKAFANSSPGLERSDNPGLANLETYKTLKGFGNWRTLSGFRFIFLGVNPRLSLRSNLGLELANGFGVNLGWHQRTPSALTSAGISERLRR